MFSLNVFLNFWEFYKILLKTSIYIKKNQEPVQTKHFSKHFFPVQEILHVLIHDIFDE